MKTSLFNQVWILPHNFNCSQTSIVGLQFEPGKAGREKEAAAE